MSGTLVIEHRSWLFLTSDCFLKLAFLVNVLREMKLGKNNNGSAQPIRFEDAPRESMGKCTVASSEQELGIASKHSMSPYFKIIAPDVVDEI